MKKDNKKPLVFSSSVSSSRTKPLSERITRRGNIKAEFVKEAVEKLKDLIYLKKRVLATDVDKIFGEFK